MNRRAFLAAFAGAALDPERALWVPKRYVQGVTLRPARSITNLALCMEAFRMVGVPKPTEAELDWAHARMTKLRTVYTPSVFYAHELASQIAWRFW